MAGNKRSALGHYSSISVQRMHEQRNKLTGHLRNYKSISGIPIHRTEIETTKSTKSVDVCLAVVSFSSTAYNKAFTRNIFVSSEFFLVCRNLNRVLNNCIFIEFKINKPLYEEQSG